ncbi:glyoxalase superfamily protein [Propionibacteriaceae bacterium Y1700]|uniref:glyoxalase superfamily protein n=1 Tax=Microlunatus sp. Y1700 TaxID=3418487 RepID=UPI003DA76ECF
MSAPGVRAAIPILRSFDEAIMRACYLDWLGFAMDWEHRFEPDLPLYCQVSRDDCTLHLSEHHGDGTPGTALWIPVADVRSLHAELNAHPRRMTRPGLELDGPGGPTVTVLDPFGNTLRFAQPSETPPS